MKNNTEIITHLPLVVHPKRTPQLGETVDLQVVSFDECRRARDPVTLRVTAVRVLAPLSDPRCTHCALDKRYRGTGAGLYMCAHHGLCDELYPVEGQTMVLATDEEIPVLAARGVLS